MRFCRNRPPWCVQTRAELLRYRLPWEGDPFILGNEHSLRHVFSNILLNAAQALKWSGDISITCRSQADSSVLVTISDNGSGVPQNLLPRLFEPFVTGKNEGTGLGLSVARKMLSASREPPSRFGTKRRLPMEP
ncbi:ATP-binding protein [Methanothrix soehngenii]|uniref:ATP-binding protein n=1 Tax=Methanothrix soehngenii TaxID=2223 RepID=UPI003AB99967